jgi:hypothetical protein
MFCAHASAVHTLPLIAFKKARLNRWTETAVSGSVDRRHAMSDDENVSPIPKSDRQEAVRRIRECEKTGH